MKNKAKEKKCVTWDQVYYGLFVTIIASFIGFIFFIINDCIVSSAISKANSEAEAKIAIGVKKGYNEAVHDVCLNNYFTIKDFN